MERFRRLALPGVCVTAFVIGLAFLVGVQCAGYGVPSKIADFFCGIALGLAAAIFQYDFVDGIARLEAADRCRRSGPANTGQLLKERIRVSSTGVLASLFWVLTVMTLVRLFN